MLNKNVVLVHNRNWQAINFRTPANAFCQMATYVATALEIELGDAGLNKATLVAVFRSPDQQSETCREKIEITDRNCLFIRPRLLVAERATCALTLKIGRKHSH